jgi:hypothetical protein
LKTDIAVIDALTGILVLVTAAYAYLTYKIAKANQASVQAIYDQSEAMFRPYISVSTFVRPNTPILYLRIENLGRTAAENLMLVVDRDFFQFGEAGKPDGNIRTMSAFTVPIDSLAPGNQLNFALAQGWIIFGINASPEVTPMQFNVTASYEFRGQKVEEVNRVDLRPYIGSEGNRDPVVEELEKIRDAIQKI